MGHFVEQLAGIREGKGDVGVEKRCCHVDMRGKAKLEYVGMKVASGGGIVERRTKF